MTYHTLCFPQPSTMAALVQCGAKCLSLANEQSCFLLRICALFFFLFGTFHTHHYLEQREKKWKQKEEVLFLQPKSGILIMLVECSTEIPCFPSFHYDKYFGFHPAQLRVKSPLTSKRLANNLIFSYCVKGKDRCGSKSTQHLKKKKIPSTTF